MTDDAREGPRAPLEAADEARAQVVLIRRVLLVFLPLAVLTLVLAAFLVQSRFEMERSVLAAQQRTDVDLAAGAVGRALRGVASDLRLLARLPDTDRLILRASPADREDLARQFLAVLTAAGTYDQVRWIDVQGMERVRVHRQDGRRPTAIAADAELQDKSDRPYARVAPLLAPDEIYVSPLDLNVEHGEIERPLRPTLRMALSVQDRTGRFAGSLVINYDAAEMMQGMRRAAGSSGERLNLVDQNGHWLMAPDPDLAWGHLLARPEDRLAERHPDAWELMRKSVRGAGETDEGLWTWTWVAPRDALGEEGALAAATRIREDGAPLDWIVYAHVPRAQLKALGAADWQRAAPTLAALLFVQLGFGVYVARSRREVDRLTRGLAERARQAEAATEAKSVFLANISHEIRTPMNGVLSLAYLLERADLPDHERQLVRKLRVAGRSLMALINDVLDFSRIDAGRVQLELQPFRLGDVLDNVGTIAGSAVGRKDVELVIGVVPEEAYAIVGDALRLEQALLNLVTNAIKFTDQGEVRVSVEVLRVSADGVDLRFAVRDTGIGIPVDQQQAILQPFQQQDASTTRRFGGTGLGLAITQGLIERMGGRLGLDSAPGRGSTFWFELHFDRAPAQAPVAGPALSVLVVDDNESTREVLVQLARSLGWQAEAAASGAQAVQRLERRLADRGRYDLLLVDWRMPEMDGLETVRVLRRLCGNTEPAPVFMMVSAYAREGLMGQAGIDVDAVLEKPILPSTLSPTVAAVLARRHRAAVRQDDGAPAPVDRLKGVRALVVDDSEINREVVSGILQLEGADVAQAVDGEDALDWLRRHPGQVDVVLMDIQMPRLDGYEATKRARRELGLRDLPIVALTAGAFRDQQESAMKAGMDDFLSKPLDVERMVAVLRRLCLPGPVDEPHGPREPPAPDPVPDLPVPVALEPDCLVARALGEERYLLHLERFASRLQDEIQVLAQPGPDARREAIRLLAHDLKGTAGNLGLPRLAAQGAALDAAIRAGAAADPLQRGVADLRRELASASAAIARHLAARPTAPVPAGSDRQQATGLDRAGLRPVFATLRQALADDDIEGAESIVVRLGAHLPAAVLEPLRRQLNAFDLRGAEAAARQLHESLDIVLD